MSFTPTPEDKFSFGIWTVGWQGVDVFGPGTREPMPAERAVRKLAEIGAYGVNFHDNDVLPVVATPAERDERLRGFRHAPEEIRPAGPTPRNTLGGRPLVQHCAPPLTPP